MNIRPPHLTSKFVNTYSKLFQGIPPGEIAPGQDADRFYSDLLDLKVDRLYLEGELKLIPKEVCREKLKPFMSSLFKVCVKQIRFAKHEDPKKQHALETLSSLVFCVLAKNLTGWEIMDLLAGSVGQSDGVFMEFVEVIDGLMAEITAPAHLRHQALRVALTFMCSVGQSSAGAYFLRRDFFPSIVSLVKSPETEKFTVQATLLLAILANYHKSDAAKMNPYLKRIRNSSDGDLMRQLCRASNSALQTAISTYQAISNPTMSNYSLESVIMRLRPDRVLGLTVPTVKLKDQPVVSGVVLLPVYEFLRANPLFTTVLLEDLVSPEGTGQTNPFPCTLITFSSYLCTHASSVYTARSIAYAGLALNMLLFLVENGVVMEFLTQTTFPSIHLCRQKLPSLPIPRKYQPLINSILDCCVLWLRHNLHKRLEVNSYTNSVWICYRIIWFLQHRRIRLDYNWTELWNSVISLLNFTSSRREELVSTGGVELLTSEAIRLLDFALSTSESYLPSPEALHEFIYELVRSSSILRKQPSLLKALNVPKPPASMQSNGSPDIMGALDHLLTVTEFYAKKVEEKGDGVETLQHVMKLIADEIEANGMHGGTEMGVVLPITRSQDVVDFARVACADTLTLIP